jgi:hypothetical protein
MPTSRSVERKPSSPLITRADIGASAMPLWPEQKRAGISERISESDGQITFTGYPPDYFELITFPYLEAASTHQQAVGRDAATRRRAKLRLLVGHEDRGRRRAAGPSIQGTISNGRRRTRLVCFTRVRAEKEGKTDRPNSKPPTGHWLSLRFSSAVTLHPGQLETTSPSTHLRTKRRRSLS